MKVFLFLIAISLALACENQCDRRNIHWLPHDTDCNRYFLCHHGNQIERTCAPDLHFNNELGQCMRPSLANCRRKCPEYDDPLNPVFLPNDQYCRNFSICYNGEAIERECAGDLVFDIERNWCDFPENVDCGHRGNNPVVIPSTTPPPDTTTHWSTPRPSPGPDDENTRTPITTRNPDIFVRLIVFFFLITKLIFY
jgi:Chitin binding Peritrophin-A domain